jgi:hypothetical protein
MGRVFIVVNLFKGPPSSSSFLAYLCSLAFSLCKNHNLQSSTTALAAAIKLLPLLVFLMHIDKSASARIPL